VGLVFSDCEYGGCIRWRRAERGENDLLCLLVWRAIAVYGTCGNGRRGRKRGNWI
jgi:hypothetical protein